MKTTKEQNVKENKGITLIALVITIIVMLILVAVTIAMAVDGGLFGKATSTGIKTNQAVLAEKDLGSGRIKIKEGSKIYEYATIDDYFTNTPSKVYEDGEVEEETPGDKPVEPENPSKICETCDGSGEVCYTVECSGADATGTALLVYVWHCRDCWTNSFTHGVFEATTCKNCRKYKYVY